MDTSVKVQCVGIIWYQEWLPETIRSLDVRKYLCGYTFFYDFNFISKLFVNFHEYANLIISILYH